MSESSQLGTLFTCYCFFDGIAVSITWSCFLFPFFFHNLFSVHCFPFFWTGRTCFGFLMMLELVIIRLESKYLFMFHLHGKCHRLILCLGMVYTMTPPDLVSWCLAFRIITLNYYINWFRPIWGLSRKRFQLSTSLYGVSQDSS